MFAGFDNLDTSNVAFVGALDRVQAGARARPRGRARRIATGAIDVQANVYSMNFHDEIAPIGALSYIGTPAARRTSASSYRRGIEADVAYRATSAPDRSARTWRRARIAFASSPTRRATRP